MPGSAEHRMRAVRNVVWWQLVFLTGLGALPWYTIAQAQALAALPGRPGTVGALQAIFVPIEITAPLLIGLVAERWGIQAGVTMFLVAPLLVLLLRPRR